MAQILLLGDEALAQGALDAGLSGCFAYPGTPSTEIMEYVQGSALAKERGVHREWSANEKTAMEEGLGMSFAGKRAMVCMKHVGMNVCADGFVNSVVTGSRGGLLVVAADDPSMHSSQNEQDSRFYAKFAMTACFEPSNQQEAYQLPSYAFAFSEKYEVPVVVRLTMRLSHSRANVEVGTAGAIPAPIAADPKDRHFVLLPAIAMKNYAKLCEKQAALIEASENSPYNVLTDGPDKSLGVIACGIGFNYVQEVFGGKCPYPVLKIGQYPLPRKLIRKLMDECDRILVVEEGMPMVEEMLRGPLDSEKILGRLSGQLPRCGELDPFTVAKAFGLQPSVPNGVSSLVKNRPPRLCDGCPHADSYKAILTAIADKPGARVFGDIGCYTLGALPPYGAISSCVDMGASISMAKGASDAGISPAIAVIGDSTFTHSGMTGLLDAVWENAPITVMILDNDTTGMTGGQSSMGAGRMEKICAGLGVDPAHIRILIPLPKNHEANVQAVQEELAYQGVSVVIFRRECIQALKHKKKG